MKASKILRIVTIVMLAFVLLVGCVSPKVKALNPGDYPEPPESQRYEVLPIYVAWNGVGSETWTYETNMAYIIREGSKPPQPIEGDVIIEDELPGGRTIWFLGISPGDVVVTFTIQDNTGKVVDIRQYAIRVYENLQLALLHYEYNSFRD